MSPSTAASSVTAATIAVASVLTESQTTDNDCPWHRTSRYSSSPPFTDHTPGHSSSPSETSEVYHINHDTDVREDKDNDGSHHDSKYENAVEEDEEDEVADLEEDEIMPGLFGRKTWHSVFSMQKTMNGQRLWEKFILWRKEVRTMYMPKLSNNLLSIPSEQQLRDAYKKFVVDRIKDENVKEFVF